MKIKLRDIQADPAAFVGEITVNGWVKTVRESKAAGFIELTDGSSFKPVQIVFFPSEGEQVYALSTGSAIRVTGTLVLTPEAKQPFEIHSRTIEVLGASAPDYPLQKKRHSLEFLRTIGHLRPRANIFQAVFRVRSVAASAVHEFFQQRGFIYVHTPILTGSDCEGAGDMFRVTTLELNDPPRTKEECVDFSKDFFSKEVHLTVSGQLYGEAFAHAFGEIYTFGPTFRAEHSYTARHAAEFWMIEPEMAFYDLADNMELAEAMVKHIIKTCLSRCPDELEFLNSFVDNGLLERLNNVAQSDFVRMDYTDAIKVLLESGAEFQYPVNWGCDLQTEHERYLTEQVYKRPVFVVNYPTQIKAFYMRVNDDDKTVAAMDLLVPGVGEIIGGSQREERLDVLESRINALKMDMSAYGWYLELRKYGGVYHAGYGLGFERMVMYLTGMTNIRDIIPFPRTAGSLEM